MFGKRVTAATVLVLMFVSVLYVPALGQVSHEDFDDAETDITALLLSLNRTRSYVEMSLENANWVNYTQDVDIEPVSSDHELKAVENSSDYSKHAEAVLGTARYILDDIQGKVESSYYIEELYLPFYNVTGNLTALTYHHGSVIFNLTGSVEIYNDVVFGAGNKVELRKGIGSLLRASYHLDMMNNSLQSLKMNVQDINQSYFDIDEIENQMEYLGSLIGPYHEYILELLELYSEIPDFDISDEYYEVIIGLPWDGNTGFKINGTASGGDAGGSNGTSGGFNYTSEEVLIDKYASSIELVINKTAYYDEPIYVQGEFDTRADIDLEDVQLFATGNRTIYPNETGSFRLIYQSEDFKWGDARIEVSYPGNESIEPSSAAVHFEISIPTGLSLVSDVNGEFLPLDGNLRLSGRLLNLSSMDGLEDREIYLYADGEEANRSITDETGGYVLNETISGLGLDKGLNEIYTAFHGTSVLRNSTSPSLYVYVMEEEYIVEENLSDMLQLLYELGDLDGDGKKDIGGGDVDGVDGEDDVDDDADGEDDEDILDVIEDRIPFSLLLLMIAIIMIAVMFWFLYKAKEEEEETIPTSEKPSKVLRLKGNKAPDVKSRDDIPHAHGVFLENLDAKGVMEIKRGTTPRDVNRELSDRAGLKGYLDDLTDLFEKAYFSTEKFTSSEIKRYRLSLKKLWGELIA